MLASVVSSRMLKAIALAEGVEYYDALTGNKYWGDKIFPPKGMIQYFAPKG